MKKDSRKKNEAEEKCFDWDLDPELEALCWPIAEAVAIIALILYC